MIKIDYKNLSQHQLLKLAHKVGLHDKELNKEWHNRYRMNFPYVLDDRGMVRNELLDISMWDEEVDSLILDQAKQLRGKRNE